MRIEVPRISVSLFKGHRYKPSHGPQTWPWWRLVSVSWVKLAGCSRNWTSGLVWGRVVWVYTRWGAWTPFEFVVDKREPVDLDRR